MRAVLEQVMSVELPAWCCASGCRGCDAYREFREKNPNAPAAERKRVYDRAKYQHRVDHEQCVDCGAGLQEGDAQRCVECNERDATAKSARARTSEGRRLKRERARVMRERFRADDVCISCGRDLDPRSTVRCAKHRLEANETQRNVRARRLAGVTPIRTETPIVKALEPYRPLDELKRKPRVRILLQLSWLDWVEPLDLFTVLNVDMSDGQGSTERNTYDVTLQRLVHKGLVEHRGVGSRTNEYRIAQAGRAEVARFRTGDFVTQKRAA